MHQRQAIREAVKAAIVSAGTSAADRVYETQTTPWERVQLPAISVYTTSEAVDTKQSAPRELTRTLQLEVVAAVEASDNVDDAMDDIAVQIERAMHTDDSFGGVCDRSYLTATENTVVEFGRKPIGFVSLVYDVIYYTYAPDAADTVLPDLSTVDVKYSLGNAQPAGDQAEDTLTNLEK